MKGFIAICQCWLLEYKQTEKESKRSARKTGPFFHTLRLEEKSRMDFQTKRNVMIHSQQTVQSKQDNINGAQDLSFIFRMTPVRTPIRTCSKNSSGGDGSEGVEVKFPNPKLSPPLQRLQEEIKEKPRSSKDAAQTEKLCLLQEKHSY